MMDLREESYYPQSVVGVNVGLACIDGVIAFLAFYQEYTTTGLAVRMFSESPDAYAITHPMYKLPSERSLLNHIFSTGAPPARSAQQLPPPRPPPPQAPQHAPQPQLYVPPQAPQHAPQPQLYVPPQFHAPHQPYLPQGMPLYGPQLHLGGSYQFHNLPQFPQYGGHGPVFAHPIPAAQRNPNFRPRTPPPPNMSWFGQNPIPRPPNT